MTKRLSVIACAVAGVVTLAGCSGPAAGAVNQNAATAAPLAAAVADTSLTGLTVAADTGARLITATAAGSVTGTPDVVTVSLGVQTNSASAQSALDENNKLATDVITIVKSNGVADADLQTSQLSINPNYDDKSAVTGYQVTNMVTAKLRDITKAGALIDAVGKSAGDAVRVQQLTFSIDDDSALRANARADAVRRAQAQAGQMAEAAWVALGPIHSITEAPVSSPMVYPQAMAAAGAADASVPLEPGSQELTVSVQVVYEIG